MTLRGERDLYRAVLFDFDYTIGDSTEGILTCLGYGLSKLGFPPASREAMRATIGLSLGPALYELTGCGDAAAAREFTRLFMEKADEVMVDASRLLPGAEELLRYLKAQKILTGVVTTKASYRIRAIFEKLGLPELLDTVIGSNDVKNEKPHPEPVFLALERLGVDAGEALYVGDSEVDARCAMDAGVDFAGVLNGTTTREALECYPNVLIARDLTELRERLWGETNGQGR